MNQNNENNTIIVTVAWNGKLATQFEDRAFIVVGLQNGTVVMNHCTGEEFLELAVHAILEVKYRLIPEFLKLCKSEITADMIFERIIEIADDYVPDVNGPATENAQRAAGIKP